MTTLSAECISAGTFQCWSWEGARMNQWTYDEQWTMNIQQVWIMWQWAGSSGPKSTQMLSEVVTMVVCITKMSHSSKFLPPISSLHYLAHSTEGLMIELGHPVEGTTILFGTQQETQESSLVPPFSPFCLHPVLQAGWSILLEISLDSVTCIMPTARSKVLPWLSTHSYSSSDYNSISSLPLQCSQHNESRVSYGHNLIMLVLSTHHTWHLTDSLQELPSLLD